MRCLVSQLSRSLIASVGGELLRVDLAGDAEHMAGGFTYTDDETVSAPAMRFDSLRGECHRVSESAVLIERRGRDMDGWRKSTYSGGNGGACVEVASADGVAVRDTTDRDGVTLAFDVGAWAAFVTRLRS
jgi:Domain of unknown function (DUF397)